MQTDNSRKDTSNAVVRYFFCIEVRSASDILAYKNTSGATAPDA